MIRELQCVLQGDVKTIAHAALGFLAVPCILTLSLREPVDFSTSQTGYGLLRESMRDGFPYRYCQFHGSIRKVRHPSLTLSSLSVLEQLETLKGGRSSYELVDVVSANGTNE